jgi:hypothetical protein
VIQGCVIFTRDSLNDKPAALGFTSKSGRAHSAARESDLRGNVQSKRRVASDGFGDFERHILYLSRARADVPAD